MEGDKDAQRFDFGELAAEDPDEAARAEELVARVEKVHAVASRGRTRRRQVVEAAENHLAQFPLSRFSTLPSPGGSDDAERIVETFSVEVSIEASTVLDESVPSESRTDGESIDDASEGGDAETLTISAFYERVQRALSGAFADEVWVTGEIRGFRESRGHRFIELADAGSEAGARQTAQLEVVCWAREWPPVGRALADAGVELEPGRVVRVRGRVSVWEGGSKLRFTLTALDVEALLGGIAAARRRLLLALEAEGLLEKNKALAMPLVPLRIGLVTSPGSEAHRDFVGQLDRSGFAFNVHLEPSLVQGHDAPGQLVRALERLRAFSPDLAVVVRGGGARGDLAAFDSEDVARAIANAPFPVWAGIGHTGDHAVVDEVAHQAWITPTACGEGVVARVASYWEEIGRRTLAISSLVRGRLAQLESRMGAVESGLARAGKHQLDRRAGALVDARRTVVRSVAMRLASEGDRAGRRVVALRSAGSRSLDVRVADADRCRQVLGAYDPERQLARGWSLTHRDGVLVRSAEELDEGARIVTRLVDGEVSSRVEAPRTS